MDNNRCDQCGRKLPCEPCAKRAAQMLKEVLLDRLNAPDGRPIILWFQMPLDAAREHLNRLRAEWPGAIDVIEPEEPDDSLGCRIAAKANELDRNPLIEYDITPTRIMPVDDESFQRAMEELIRRELDEE